MLRLSEEELQILHRAAQQGMSKLTFCVLRQEGETFKKFYFQMAQRISLPVHGVPILNGVECPDLLSVSLNAVITPCTVLPSNNFGFSTVIQFLVCI